MASDSSTQRRPTATSAVDLTANHPDDAAFAWYVPADRWHWSPGCYELHGYRPGEVRPTTGRFLDHRHPGDLHRFVNEIHRGVAGRRLVLCEHRLIDIHGDQQDVVLIGRGRRRADGEVLSFSGFLVPLELGRATVDQRWFVDAIAVATGLSRLGARSLLSWHRRLGDPHRTEQALIAAAETALLSNEEQTLRDCLEDLLFPDELFSGPRGLHSS